MPMALPVGGSDQWPPADCRCYVEDARAWAAWWSGDLTELMATSGHDTGDAFLAPTRERQFNVGPSQRRRFWQRRSDSRDQSNPMRAVHAPLAADIAETSADLLFGEPPDLVVEAEHVPAPVPTEAEPDPMVDREAHAAFQMKRKQQEIELQAARLAANAKAQAEQAAIEQVVEDAALWARLLEGAESCAAVGGVYLRPAWDVEVAQHALLQVVDQSQAVPEFRWGRLVAVTFWEEVERKGNTVLRHLERHEPGQILHGLYAGTAQVLGEKIGLASHPATAQYQDVVPLPEGMPRPLLVEYVPNVLPNRRHRHMPVGRSDIAGSETFLDALDEVWSSWMRDVRLGQAKVLVPDEFLQPAGTRPGDGKTFDLDRELLTGLNIAELEKVSDPMKLIQPEIRNEAHATTALDLVRSIVSAAGYSPQTFGIDIDGQAESGTALRVKEKKTLHTVKRKRGYWDAPVANTVQNLMALNAALFGGPPPVRPRVDWPDLTDDPVERAETTSLWHAAQAVSLWERVRARNPHWDEEQIAEEVEKIEGEKKAAMAMELPPLDESDDDDGE